MNYKNRVKKLEKIVNPKEDKIAILCNTDFPSQEAIDQAMEEYKQQGYNLVIRLNKNYGIEEKP